MLHCPIKTAGAPALNWTGILIFALAAAPGDVAGSSLMVKPPNGSVITCKAISLTPLAMIVTCSGRGGGPLGVSDKFTFTYGKFVALLVHTTTHSVMERVCACTGSDVSNRNNDQTPTIHTDLCICFPFLYWRTQEPLKFVL